MADELPISNDAAGDEPDPLDHQSDEQPPQGTGEGEQPQPQDAGPSLPPDLAEALRRERLPQVPGETTEAAYIRLSTHLQGKNNELWRQIKVGERQSRQQQAELRQMLEPMLRDYYQRQRHAQLEEQAAQIPPKDSPEYQVWLAEEVLRRDDERRQQEEQAALTWQEQQAIARQQQQLAAVDQAGYAKVYEGLGMVQGVEADPEFVYAYDLFSNAAQIAAQDYFPGEDPEKIMEFIALSQRLDIRRAEEAGYDYRVVLKRRLGAQIDMLVQMGLVQRVAGGTAQEPKGSANGNGNGQQPQQQRPTQQTVAQQVKAGAAAAAKRGPSAVPSSNRPTQLSGQIPDPNKFDSDDDYVEAALAGLLGGEEQRTGMHRKNR